MESPDHAHLTNNGWRAQTVAARVEIHVEDTTSVTLVVAQSSNDHTKPPADR